MQTRQITHWVLQHHNLTLSKNLWNWLKLKMNCLVVSPWSLKVNTGLAKSIFTAFEAVISKCQALRGRGLTRLIVSRLFQCCLALYHSQPLNSLTHTHTHIASIYLLLTNADHNERLSLRDHSQQGQYQSSKVWLPELVFSIFHPIALHAIRLLSVIIGSGHKNPWWQIWLHNQIAAEWIQSASKLSMQTWNLLPGDCGTREVFPIRQRDFCQGIYPS